MTGKDRLSPRPDLFSPRVHFILDYMRECRILGVSGGDEATDKLKGYKMADLRIASESFASTEVTVEPVSPPGTYYVYGDDGQEEITADSLQAAADIIRSKFTPAILADGGWAVVRDEATMESIEIGACS